MPTEVIMPKVDMDMTHGTFAVWHAAEGMSVAQGAPLFDIETEKAAMEVEAPAAGRLHHTAARPGDRIPVGATIGWLYADGEEVGPPPSGRPVPGAAERAEQPFSRPRLDPPHLPGQVETTLHSPPSVLPPVRATPAARATARAAGLSLEQASGTGPAGRIQKADVLALLHADRDERNPGGWTPESGPLHVTHRPGSGDPILLIHGFASDSRSWAPLEAALGETRQLLRIDLPGHGKSPRRRVSSFALLARMLVDRLDEVLGPAGRAHIVGHSLGGALALAAADVRPRKVASLTLIAPAGLGPEIDANVLAGIARASRVESLAPWLRRLTATPDAISDEYARAAFRSRTAPHLRAYQTELADILFPDGVQAFDLRPALGRLDLPAQIIWGRDDQIVPFRQAIAARADLGLFLIDGAGHVPQFERPDRVARIVLQLARAVEALV